MQPTDLVLEKVRPKLLRQLLLVDEEGVGQLLFLLEQAVQQRLQLLGRHVVRQVQLRTCRQAQLLLSPAQTCMRAKS